MGGWRFYTDSGYLVLPLRRLLPIAVTTAVRLPPMINAISNFQAPTLFIFVLTVGAFLVKWTRFTDA